jgi:REP element-mobilizing transposase RayT
MSYEKIEPGHYYHIFNQGNNQEDVFKENMNYNYFLRLLEKHVVPVADIFSYCLLKNHFHLLIRTKELKEERQCSKAISNVCNAYAKAINKKYSRTGSLFRDRFKRIRVMDEQYLRQLILYINLNPIYHGFTNNIFTYRYSSLVVLLSKRKTMLKRQEVWELFHDRENFQYCIEMKKLEFDEKMKALVFE